MAKREWLGTEGGTEHLILITYRNPWGLYLSAKTPWVRDVGLRLRFAFGPQFRNRRWPHLIPYLRLLPIRKTPSWWGV